MGAKGSSWRELNARSALLIAVLVGAFTVVNASVNEPVSHPQEPESGRYSDFGFSFDYTGNLTFTAVEFQGENSSRDQGQLVGISVGDEAPFERLAVCWDKWVRGRPLGESLEEALALALPCNASYTCVSLENSTQMGHPLLLVRFNASLPLEEGLQGLAGAWFCNVTDRMFNVVFLSSGGGDLGGFEEACREMLDSFVCHSYRPPRRGLSSSFIGVEDLPGIAAMVFLCTGFTFTYMMDGFLNLAHITYAGLGGLVSSHLVRFYGFPSYDTWPIAALVGGLLGMLLYVALVRPIGTRVRRWTRYISLTFAFWVVAQFLTSTYTMYGFWSRELQRSMTTEFTLGGYGFSAFGLSGGLVLGLAYCVVFVVGINVFLTRTRFGISLRATALDEGLASILGIDIFQAHLASWFISGALSAMAGAIFGVGGGMGGGSDSLMVSVMAGSILGGLYSVRGAIVGGVFISLAERTINFVLVKFFGIDMNMWFRLLPILLLWAVLAVAPDGVTELRLDRGRLIREARLKMDRLKAAFGLSDESPDGV